MKKLCIVAFLGVFLVACQENPTYYLFPDSAPYEVKELTKSNLFSHNIEGPAFRNDTLFVVNYEKDGTIGYVLPNGKCQLYTTLPDSSIGNSLKFDKKGNMYVADFVGHNILKIDKKKNISVYCHNDQFNQPNDMVMNRKGWIYASDPNWEDSTGQIWLIKGQGQAIRVADSMGTTNGITLSPDEKHLYIGESVQLKIWKFDVNKDGSLSGKRLFTTFKKYDMDGMHFGPKGNLFVCRYGEGVIAVFSPQGEQIKSIPLKAKKCSNLVFGDPDGKTVFVTLQDKKGMEMFRIK